MIEIVDQAVPSHSLAHEVEVEVEVVSDWSLAAVAYASFFTESERDEIGTFDELPAPERARWESVAAHIARTVASPIDEDLDAWRTEQRTVLAEQVRVAPYSRELWRARTRTSDMQQQIAALRDLLVASRASIATARSHSERLASSTQALEHPMWWDRPAAEHDGEHHPVTDHGSDGLDPTRRHDRPHSADSARHGDRVIRRA